MRNNLESNIEEAILAWRRIGPNIPINENTIEGFHNWINWNGYRINHEGFDFASYVNKDGECVLGLPKETPVYPLADGEVVRIHKDNDSYKNIIFIRYDINNYEKLISLYGHVVPEVKEGDLVSKTKRIGRLYHDSGYRNRLVHLHLELLDPASESLSWKFIDPLTVFDFGYLQAIPQNSWDFRIDGLDFKPEIKKSKL
ncbi:MAG: M23 family metallopeptidase [Candidatus Pacearchaeota archaeon]|jgi:murein DD-endopeptidase MepM/ murein hydrolase activator NlpD